MKTILTSSVLATMLVMTISGCGSSSTTKKVYLNGSDSNGTAHQVGTSSTDSGTRDSTSQTTNNTQNKNIERVAMNIGATTVQNLQLHTGEEPNKVYYEALSISGDGSGNFIILDKDVYPKNDIANGEYNIIIHAKAIGGTETVDKELIIEVTGSTVVGTIPAADTNSSTTPAVVSGFTTVTEKPGNGDGRWSWSEADAECKTMGMRLPTIAEIQDNEADVLAAAAGVDSDGDSRNGILFSSVIWSSSSATKGTMGEARRWGYNYNSNPTESGAFAESEKFFFTCVPK
jgi:hypothetical protein